MQPGGLQTSSGDCLDRLFKPSALRPCLRRSCDFRGGEVGHHGLETKVLLPLDFRAGERAKRHRGRCPVVSSRYRSPDERPGARRRLREAASARRSIGSRSQTTGVKRWRMTASASLPSSPDMTRMRGCCSGAIPAAPSAARTASPSATSATPSHSAPARASTGAHIPAPCP